MASNTGTGAANATDAPTQVPPVPADATNFAFPKGATWIMLVSLLVAFTESAVLLVGAWFTADPTTRITQIPEGIFLALVAELNWRFFLSSRHRVAVNAEGIWSIRRKHIRYLNWRDVAHAWADDRMQRLELANASGLTTIRIEYQLKNFERLRDFVLSHTSQSAQVQTRDAGVFRRSWEFKIVVAAAGSIFLFVAWFVYRHFTGHVFVLPILLAAAALILFFLDPISVLIGHDGILIGYPGYQRTIPFNSVTGISLSDVRYRGNVWAGVRIDRRAGGAIRLTRFRGGSVALYEALRSAWQLACGAAAPLPRTAGTTTAAPAPSLPARTPYSRGGLPGVAKTVIVAVALVVAGIAAIFVSVVFAWFFVPRVPLQYLRPPIYEVNAGPVARPDELKGKGRIYLVQMGEHRDPYSMDDFAKWLHAKYALDVQVLPAMEIDSSAWDEKRHKYVAELLEAQLKQNHPDLAQDEDAYLIGFTDRIMYSTEEMWDSTFTQRDRLRAAIISSDGMKDTPVQLQYFGSEGAVDRFQARLKRILLKDVAVLYWHLPVNDDPTSLLHNTLDPDLPTEEIYESDAHPASTEHGERIEEPCLFFTYSSKDGLQPQPGPAIRGCGDVQDPMQNESTEVFEIALRFGLLIDKRTDSYLPGMIPIEFQRVTRFGERGRDPFGVSGWDNYDEFLGSADNIHIFIEHADGARDNLTRVPEWMPFQGLAKFVGGDTAWASSPGFRAVWPKRVWQYQMAWHALPFEHYDVQQFNGGVATYLPCDTPDVNCSLVGYRDSQGRELKIERDSNRHLSRITSPNGRWVGVASAPDGRILAIDDSDGRTVLYTYDAANRLVAVTYPSGENLHYCYDDAGHLLSFSVAADSGSEPRLVLTNGYEEGLLTKQTLSNGDVYTYAYDSSNPKTIHHATVKTPDGATYSIDVSEDLSVVHEVQRTTNNAQVPAR